MAIAIRKQQARQAELAPRKSSTRAPVALAALSELGKLAGADIETRLVGDLSRDLHAMFDPVTSATLPIYFGPLLGRLYLEGL